MEISALRKEIHRFVDEADMKSLVALRELIEFQLNDSKESSKKAMIARALQSQQEIENGELISANQFKEDFDHWKKEKRATTK